MYHGRWYKISVRVIENKSSKQLLSAYARWCTQELHTLNPHQQLYKRFYYSHFRDEKQKGHRN